MITVETIKQAKRNIDERNNNKTFNFKSFVIGLVVGLIIMNIFLLVLL